MIHCEVIYDTHYTWNYDNEQVGTWEDYGILYYITSGQKIVSVIMQLYASLANKSTLHEEK